MRSSHLEHCFECRVRHVAIRDDQSHPLPENTSSKVRYEKASGAHLALDLYQTL